MTDISTQRRGPCPLDLDLASFVDGDLTTEARAAVVKHLAWCDDCREVVAMAAEELEQRTPVQPWFRRQAVGLGLAATLVAGLAVSLLLNSRPPAPIDLWTDLDAAIGSARTVDARLADQPRYRELASPTRAASPTAGAPANYALEALVSRLREAARSEPSAANLRGLGVAMLLSGHANDAVRALTGAAAQEAGNARILSDLSAAYAARAAGRAESAAGRSADWGQALDAAQRARDLDPSLAAAWFNRALALGGLGRGEDAQRAWHDYTTRFSVNDGWRDEALSRSQPEPR